MCMMRLIKISSVALVLLVIGVSSQPGTQFRQQSVALLMSEKIGTAAEGSTAWTLPPRGACCAGKAWPRGRACLKEKCSTCHSVNFVLNSGMLAGEVDSTITIMINKGSFELNPHDQQLIRTYLEDRLPRE